jgi:hypothetical protein
MLSDSTLAWMQDFVGKPLAKMKEALITKITSELSQGRPMSKASPLLV